MSEASFSDLELVPSNREDKYIQSIRVVGLPSSHYQQAAGSEMVCAVVFVEGPSRLHYYELLNGYILILNALAMRTNYFTQSELELRKGKKTIYF